MLAHIGHAVDIIKYQWIFLLEFDWMREIVLRVWMQGEEKLPTAILNKKSMSAW